jgi:hypothetical protein
MIAQLEYLNLPTIVIIVIVAFLVISNIIGSFLKLKGVITPEFMRIKDYLKRKKKEREELRKIPLVLSETQKTLNEVNAHYNTDRISMRNDWMELVNKKLETNEKSIKDIAEKLEKNHDITMSMWIDSKRNYIIDFAARVSDKAKPVTREQFRRAFKIHNEYESIIEEHGISNGEVDVAMKIINEAYETHMKNHTFIEDVRGY